MHDIFISPGEDIYLGRQGDYGFLRFRFDLRHWIHDAPGGTGVVDIEIHVEPSTASGVAAGNGTNVRILQLSDCTVSAKPFAAAGGKTVKSTITL